MTYVLIVVVAFVLAFVVLLSSRFFLLDETHHVIRQKKITVIVACVGSVFPVHEGVHEGVIPVGTSSCHRLHLHHELLRRHIHWPSPLVVVVVVVAAVSAMAVIIAVVILIVATVVCVISAVVMTRLSIWIGPVARRNRRFLLRDHHVAVVVVVAAIVVARCGSMRRAAVAWAGSVSWRHDRRMVAVVAGNGGATGHVTVGRTLIFGDFTVVISAVVLALLASHSVGVVVIVVVVAVLMALWSASGGAIGAVGARGAQRKIVLEVRVIDR